VALQTTLPAQHQARPYLIQWERTLRWRERTAEALAEIGGWESFDYLFALFASLFHMRDWLTASRPDLKAEIEELFHASSNLALVRDLANGAKHMTLHSYSVDGAATVAREYAGQGRTRYVVPRAGGRNVEALQLADACIAELRSFMNDRGLI
jgi:hypothetical protein